MRDIEGIEKVVESFKPHWSAIEAHFNKENERFKALMNRDHDVLGQILKCHLIVEHYLDRFLSTKYPGTNIEEARLTFFQKAKLLPDAGSSASFVKPGIVRLNYIRNKFGHSLEACLDPDALGPIDEVLDVARHGATFSNTIERIQAFTTIACTWLILPPPGLEQVFLDAFSQVRVTIDSMD